MPNCWLTIYGAFKPPETNTRWWLFEEEYHKGYFFASVHHIRWPSETPLFCDAIWHGSFPDRNDDVPSDLEFGERSTRRGSYMSRFCIDRHRMRIGMVYVDGSAHPVPLPMLWAQRWHRKYEARYDVKVPR